MILLISLIIPTILYMIFRDTIDLLQVIGPIYWITRNNGVKGHPFISIGFMRQIGYPWRRGRGIQVRIGRYVLQVGLCRTQKKLGRNEYNAVTAFDGRILDTDTETIRKWK